MIKLVLLGFGLYFFVACASSTEVTESESLPQQKRTSQNNLPFEEVVLQGIRIQIFRDCRLKLVKSTGERAIWKVPFKGPCNFAKDRTGKPLIYDHSSAANKNPTERLILVRSAAPRANGDCDGTNVGIMVREGKVLIQNSPYPRYTACWESVDLKHYSTTWFVLLESKNYFQVKF